MSLHAPSPAMLVKALLAAALAAVGFSSIVTPQASTGPPQLGDAVLLHWDRFGSPGTVTRIYRDGVTFDVTRGDEIFIVTVEDVQPCD